MALRVISLRCNDLSAFGAKRTLACRPPERIYEFTPWSGGYGDGGKAFLGTSGLRATNPRLSVDGGALCPKLEGAEAVLCCPADAADLCCAGIALITSMIGEGDWPIG
jgi:hypothetical protein